MKGGKFIERLMIVNDIDNENAYPNKTYGKHHSFVGKIQNIII